MSSSDPDSKIDFLDGPDAVRRKIKKAFCEEGNVEDNGVLSFVEAVLIPISELRIERAKGETGADAEEGAGAVGDQTPFAVEGAPEATVFSIFRKEEYGGSLHYSSFDALKEDFREKKLHPKDLKAAVADAIVRLLDPIRQAFQADEEWQKVEKLAYPDPNAKPEKKKKVRLLSFPLIQLRWRVHHCTAQGLPPPTSGQRQERKARRGLRPRRGRSFNRGRALGSGSREAAGTLFMIIDARVKSLLCVRLERCMIDFYRDTC